MSIGLKMWPLQHTQGSEPSFLPNINIFKLFQDFNEENILTKFHENLTKNVASIDYTRIF